MNLGLDENHPGMQKAAQYWDMLDDLHKTDPEAYKKLIAEQMNKGKTRSRTRQFIPKPGFVIKTFSRPLVGTGVESKIFINICEFEGVEPPTSANGNVLADSAHGYQARSIPLLVSPLRKEQLQKNGEAVQCVDVVFNPWVLAKSQQEKGFKQQAIRLALKWVQDETSLFISVPRARVINSLYKGGRGPHARDPVPFPITLSEEEMRELYPEETHKKSQAQVPNPASAEPSILQSPDDLLKAFQSEPDEQDTNNQVSTGSSESTPKSALDELLNVKSSVAQPAPRKPLIREVTPAPAPAPAPAEQPKPDQRHPGIRVVGEEKKAEKKKKTAVRKGFMFRKKKGGKKRAPLYPKGSNEHKPQNPYP